MDGSVVGRSYELIEPWISYILFHSMPEALNAFTSARKRQSVLVRRPTGEAVLLVKGADDVMQKLAQDVAAFPEEHLRSFAKQGLRTLVLGRRCVQLEELQGWHEAYLAAQSSIQESLLRGS